MGLGCTLPLHTFQMSLFIKYCPIFFCQIQNSIFFKTFLKLYTDFFYSSVLVQSTGVNNPNVERSDQLQGTRIIPSFLYTPHMRCKTILVHTARILTFLFQPIYVSMTRKFSSFRSLHNRNCKTQVNSRQLKRIANLPSQAHHLPLLNHLDGKSRLLHKWMQLHWGNCFLDILYNIKLILSDFKEHSDRLLTTVIV